MKKLGTLLLLSACTTTQNSNLQRPAAPDVPRVTVMGKETPQIKSSSLVDLTEADWGDAIENCVTHIYACQYNDKGQVTQLKPLDLSRPLFQNFTEEAVRSWEFQSGQNGTCHTQVIYERGRPTRVLLVSEDVAQDMVKTHQQNRAAIPKLDSTKPKATGLKQPKLEVPREMALKGQSGYISFYYDIDPDGVPTNIQVIDEEPEGAWEASALRAVRQWRYAKLADEPNSLRQAIVSMTIELAGNPVLSTCNVGLKLNRMARAHLPLQENTTGPRQAPNPSLK